MASGLVQLESEFTDTGLEGPELGERSSANCSTSAGPESSLSNTELLAQSWRAAGSWLKRMATDSDEEVALLRAAVILPVIHGDGYMLQLHQ